MVPMQYLNPGNVLFLPSKFVTLFLGPPVYERRRRNVSDFGIIAIQRRDSPQKLYPVI